MIEFLILIVLVFIWLALVDITKLLMRLNTYVDFLEAREMQDKKIKPAGETWMIVDGKRMRVN